MFCRTHRFSHTIPPRIISTYICNASDCRAGTGIVQMPHEHKQPHGRKISYPYRLDYIYVQLCSATCVQPCSLCYFLKGQETKFNTKQFPVGSALQHSVEFGFLTSRPNQPPHHHRPIFYVAPAAHISDIFYYSPGDIRQIPCDNDHL